MYRRFILCYLALTLSACVSIELQTHTPVAAPLFVTSTLPPTRKSPPISTNPPQTSVTPETTLNPATSTNCRDKAVLLADVTIPDNTSLSRGAKFTKTWRLENVGTCTWSGYKIAFLAGDRMGASDSIPVTETQPGADVDVSVDLQAPAQDGAYAGYYELRNAQDEIIPIGIERSFWVKIVVGNAVIPGGTGIAGTASTSIPLITPGGPLSCDYFLSKPYQTELAGLINSARTQAGLPALSIDAQLAAAAQDHSIDMACFGSLSHSGSDGSSIYERITAAGYLLSHYGEIIYASGYPQSAFDWWMNDQLHRDEILDPAYTEMGVGYAYNADSFYKGYYTVDFGGR